MIRIIFAAALHRNRGACAAAFYQQLLGVTAQLQPGRTALQGVG
jgi:hypothetical protein